MSDHDDPARSDGTPEESLDEHGFDDPAYDELRALLAETRVTDPVPADVAARLDETLHSLRDQRRADAGRPESRVVVLRRRAGRVLVAAAVVVLVGGAAVGIVRSAQNGGQSDANADKASSATADQEGGGSTTSAGPALPGVQALKGLAGPPRLTTAHFSRDVTRTMRRLALADGDFVAHGYTPGSTSPEDSPGTLDSIRSPRPAPPVTATPTPAPQGTSATTRDTSGCTDPGVPGAVDVPAVLDGAAVTLVFRPPTDGAQVVEAWSCDGATVLAATTVPH